MKAILQKVPISVDFSFAVRNIKGPYFDIPWHFHPEYELVLIVKSEGKRFVGDSITNFFPGDLVLLGSNIPHWYRNDDIYYDSVCNLGAESIVIQFTNDFIGESFFSKPETTGIKKILQKASLGIEIVGKTRNKIAKMMYGMLHLGEMERLILLLSIFNLLSNSDDLFTLSNQGALEIDIEDSARINKVYEYVLRNYTKQISIDEVSNLVNMSASTFCRYFKKRTNKTFTHFLNEIRIGHVCKLLADSDMNITEICLSSGYNNISYFNRKFKKLKGKTPQYFKKEYNKT